MKAPAIPPDEELRLEALHGCRILDTEPEPAFDGLTNLAASMLEAPIALVTLVDRTRQWFKSRHGIDVIETPREVSFCGHVVENKLPIVVLDTLEDPRFFDNPFVLGEPRVRFYAGMPLRTPDGHVLGTLCVIDHVPRAPTPKQIELLGLLAAQAEAQLESRRKDAVLAIERKRVHELNQGSEMLLECLEEAVVVHDQRGVMVRANGAARRMFGRELLSEITGRSTLDELFTCVREDGSPFPTHRLPSAVARGTKAPCSEIVGIGAPGSARRWLLVRAYPVLIDGFVDTTVVTLAEVARDGTTKS